MPRGSSATAETVLIYDGDCGFCALWVSRLQRALPTSPRAITSQEADLDALGLTAQDVRDYAWLITPGRHIAGADILPELLVHQKQFGARFLGHLLRLWPVAVIARGVYALIARTRHVLPGGTTECRVEEPR